MRKRVRNAKQARAGVIAVEDACNKLDLIWRSLLEEDVGIDGTIEIALGDFPTGKIVGAQVKSGTSYIRSETNDCFKFYPDKDDLAYWRGLSIPMFLLMHHPVDAAVYWVDVTQYVESRGDDPLGEASITFLKSNRIDQAFETYLQGRFDFTVYTDEQYADVRRELESVVHEDGSGPGAIRLTALDLFVEGLWGLCSKLQFHSSLLADRIRKTVREREGAIPITYTFDRSRTYPFLTRYFALLSKHHLAEMDAANINESLYAKLEFPTFIAPLTTNGRLFVKYLQRTEVPNVHDNQFMSFSVRPHVQIEVYSTFTKIDEHNGQLGPFTDVLAIGFNAYLDYYELSHWRRDAPDQPTTEIASQNIHYFGLRDYIQSRFDDIPKDNILFRYLDLPLSPLICWLERWNDNPMSMPTAQLGGKSAAELAGLADELQSIMASAVATFTEPPDRPFPITRLTNGETLRTSKELQLRR